MFGKNKKQTELESRLEREREEQRIEEERQRQEKLKREIEEAEAMAAEARKNNTPYRFSTPDPMPKELVSVLKEMLKKLFPDAKKAYLVYTQYEEKAGYLLVVDIDAKFHKIINLYLEGETKKVRNGLPIECILYSKSGALTEGMEPFYQKEVSEASAVTGAFADLSSLGISTDFSFDDIFGFESSVDGFSDEVAFGEIAEETNEDFVPDEEITEADDTFSDEETPSPEECAADEEVVPESEDASDLSDTEAQQIEFKIEEEPVRVKPETKQQLFALMTRAAKNDSEDVISVAVAGFGEFEFYIPFISDDGESSENFEISSSFPENAQHFHLINRDTGIKATVFFTDGENAADFAQSHNCSLAKMRYSDYKNSLGEGKILSPSAEGIIINPDAEKILLPPDYILL